MAVITQTTVSGVNGPVTLTRTTLGASDTLTYSSGTRQMLDLVNPTAGSLTVTITGSTSTTISPTGYGGTIDVSAGKTITLAAGAQAVVNLDTISVWLSGTVTLTGASGLVAALYA